MLNLGDTGTATGELVFTVIGAIAQFERALMLERQKEGIAKAKPEGKYKRRPSQLHEKLGEIRDQESQGFNRADRAPARHGPVLALSCARGRVDGRGKRKRIEL